MLIRSNIKEDGFVRIDDEIRLGDRVIVKDGPLKNFAGIFEREMKDTDRIRILLETVNYQDHAEIERESKESELVGGSANKSSLKSDR